MAVVLEMHPKRLICFAIQELVIHLTSALFFKANWIASPWSRYNIFRITKSDITHALWYFAPECTSAGIWINLIYWIKGIPNLRRCFEQYNWRLRIINIQIKSNIGLHELIQTHIFFFFFFNKPFSRFDPICLLKCDKISCDQLGGLGVKTLNSRVASWVELMKYARSIVAFLQCLLSNITWIEPTILWAKMLVKYSGFWLLIKPWNEWIRHSRIKSEKWCMYLDQVNQMLCWKTGQMDPVLFNQPPWC